MFDTSSIRCQTPRLEVLSTQPENFPVILEDALGFQLPIPMDWIDGWVISILPTLTQKVTIHPAQEGT